MALFPKTNFGGSGFGGNIDARENVKDAARAQEMWINQAADARRGGYQNALNTWRNTFAPYQGFGGRRVAAWENLLNDPSSVTSTPGYEFRRNQGREGIENSAAARGGLLSGNALRSIEEYGQDYASNEYDKALGREMQGAQFGATVDTNYASAMAQLEKELGLSDATKFGDFSNYAFWHEQQGMEEAKGWSDMFKGMLGGKGFGDGGGSGSSSSGSGQQWMPQGNNNSQGSQSSAGGSRSSIPGVMGGFNTGGQSNNAFLSYYNPSGGAGNAGYPTDQYGNIDWDQYLRGSGMNFRY